MKSGPFWCPVSTKNWEGRLNKRKHLLKIQSDRVIWLFNGSDLSTKSRKLESFFKHRINRDIKEKEKKKEKARRIKKEKIKKTNLCSLGFYVVFDCIRHFKRLKMVPFPKTYFFAILKRFAKAMPETLLTLASLQCRRILGGRNLVRVRIVVAAIFDFMTVKDWGE